MIDLSSHGAVYVGKQAFLTELKEELVNYTELSENLLYSSILLDVCFAEDIWFDPQVIKFESISQAAKILRGAGRFWYLHPLQHIRRARLIESQLRNCPPLTRQFPLETDIPNIGVFSLLDQHTLIYSAKRLKKWPDGQCQFIEDKINPPNRAYLKLWEALLFLEKQPKSGDTVLDLGASPGGWTYVMQSLGAKVTAIDKAPLATSISQLPNVHSIQQSAFSFDPNTITEAPYDWVLSDIACYPERAYELIMKWINSGKAKQMIFTIKLQGKTDMSIIKKFQAIPHSRIINLYYNKNEATFFYPVSA